VLGVVGYFVNASLSAAKEAQRVASEVQKARSKPEPPRAPPAPAVEDTVFVVIVSDPLEAQVKATWKGGEKEGPAPLSLEAPKNARIHVEMTRSGHYPYSGELFADSSQTFTAKMTPIQVSAVTPPPAEHEKPQHEKTAKKKKQGLPDKADGLIDINDALK
jgi:hypothetical protein